MEIKRVTTFLFWFCVGMVLAIVILTGCDELHRTIRDANDVARVGDALLQSPVGQSLPPDMRLWGSLAVTMAMGGAAAYEKWRLSQMSKTTKAIVRGIERAEQSSSSNPEPPVPVKTAIAAEMRKLGVYDVGNKLVDRLKIG